MWRRLMSRFTRSERGATAVEFALVAGPFFFLLGGIIETGIMLFTEYVLQNATQTAARTIRTGQASSADGTPSMVAADFKALICETVELVVDCNGKVTVYVDNGSDFVDLEGIMPEPLDIGPAADGTPYPEVFNPGARLRAATVVATYDWDFAFSFLELLGNVNDNKARRVYGMAIFRNEPF